MASGAHLTLHSSGYRSRERWAPVPEGLEKRAGAKRTSALGQGRVGVKALEPKAGPLGVQGPGAGAGPPEIGTLTSLVPCWTT